MDSPTGSQSTADSLEVQVVKLQLQVAQLTLEALGLQQRLAQYQHRDALQAAGVFQQRLRELQTPAEAPLSSAEQELIAKINLMSATELPAIVTSQAPDGSLQVIDGATHQPRPLTPVERATYNRMEELRKAAGG